mmetsp:Transcript_27704/g.56051  ORF Transcript_27704/g.56051 Transcript_27704/m.56051 type:complete len:411 (-) Transcript_27704:28-1260(-)
MSQAERMLLHQEPGEGKREERRAQAEALPVRRGEAKTQALYARAAAVRERREALVREGAQARSEAEVQGCTFRPNTAKSGRSFHRAHDTAAPIPKGFHQTRERLRSAGEAERQRRQQLEDRLGRIGHASPAGNASLAASAHGRPHSSSRTELSQGASSPLPSSAPQDPPQSFAGFVPERRRAAALSPRTAVRPASAAHGGSGSRGAAVAVGGSRPRARGGASTSPEPSRRGSRGQEPASARGPRPCSQPPCGGRPRSQPPRGRRREALQMTHDPSPGPVAEGTAPAADAAPAAVAEAPVLEEHQEAVERRPVVDANVAAGRGVCEEVGPEVRQPQAFEGGAEASILACVDVNISPGKPPERIVFYQGQTVNEVASDFATQHGLAPALAKRLEVLLVEVLSQRVDKLQADH